MLSSTVKLLMKQRVFPRRAAVVVVTRRNLVSVATFRALSASPNPHEAMSVEQMVVAIEGMLQPEHDDVDSTLSTNANTAATTAAPETAVGKPSHDAALLPRTLIQALSSPTSRAVVITESTPPYRVWNVNAAWQRLCGHTLSEARHHTLGSLLADSEVNGVKAMDLARRLVEDDDGGGDDEVQATVSHYKKCGRRTVDHLRLGPLRNARGRVTHLVGVVDEVVSTAS